MITRLYLAFNAIGIGLIGLAYLYDPNMLLALYGLEAGSAGMDNMLRAAYGGVFAASALVFSIGIFQPARRRDAVGFTVLFMTGAAIGRLASIIAAGAPPAMILSLLAFECVSAAIGFALYVRSPNAPA